MNHLKKAIKILANFFTGVLLIILILVIYGKAVLIFSENAYPNYFGYTFFEVVSGSMEPTLNINDVILVKVTRNDLKKDDIIAFVNEKSVITHRIVYQEGDVITVKGDSNNTIDKPINVSQVIWKVVKIYPKLGVWKKVITDPKVLILIFVTLLLFDYALSYNKKDKDKKVLIKQKEKPSKEVNEKREEPKEEVTIKKIEIPKETEAVKREEIPYKESEKLLELTRKINIEEINKLLEGSPLELNKEEINNVKNEITKIENKEVKETSTLTEKEQEFINYTIRLDLSEIQKKIDERIR